MLNIIPPPPSSDTSPTNVPGNFYSASAAEILPGHEIVAKTMRIDIMREGFSMEESATSNPIFEALTARATSQ